MMPHLNRIATAVPAHDVHETFIRFAAQMLQDRHAQVLFRRMAARAGIRSRFSCMAPAPGVSEDTSRPSGKPDDPAATRAAASVDASVDADGVFTRSAFPATAVRMALFERYARGLLRHTLDRLALSPEETAGITHVLVTTCTGFYAPGLDFDIVDQLGLNPAVERVMIGFMGCYAAINALRMARHIVRSAPDATVLIVNLELCTIHLQETQDLEQVLSFLLFGDGCAACLVSARPMGLALDGFQAVRLPGTADLITWRIGDAGFDMLLSGRVPAAIGQALKTGGVAVTNGQPVDLWAVHPGGRSVLDAVEAGLQLPPAALAASRGVLAQYGNMSSATIMFVLQALMGCARAGQTGCAMSFGPGVTAETMLFHVA